MNRVWLVFVAKVVAHIQYYFVKINIPNEEYKVCFNSTSTYFDFTEALTFAEREQYQVSIIALPTKRSITTTMVKVGSCPRKGEWGSWSDFDECDCKCTSSSGPQCTGVQTRKRKCLRNRTMETADYNCEGNKNSIKDPCNKACSISTPATKIGYVIGGVGGAILIIGFLYAFVYRDRKFLKCVTQCRNRETPGIKPLQPTNNVYISYVCEPHEENRILRLAHYISSFNLHCIMDLLCTVEINRMGGLPHWVPYKMSTANKIMVVLSKTYIKALNSTQESLKTVPDKVCKVHTEFNLIKTIMYHSCQKTPQLVIVLDGVKKEDIPTVFRGRYHCVYPSKLNDDEESSKKLIGLLLDMNPIQLISSEI